MSWADAFHWFEKSVSVDQLGGTLLLKRIKPDWATATVKLENNMAYISFWGLIVAYSEGHKPFDDRLCGSLEAKGPSGTRDT